MSIQPAMDDNESAAPPKVELASFPPYIVGMWVAVVVVPDEPAISAYIKRIEGNQVTVRETTGKRVWTIEVDTTVLPFGRRRGPRRSLTRKLIQWLRP